VSKGTALNLPTLFYSQLMIFYFAKSFQEISADPASEEFLESVRELSFTFLVLGYVYFGCKESDASRKVDD
jgi:hypothetical protein